MDQSMLLEILGQLNGLLALGHLQPVSYTHLDVYKRQCINYEVINPMLYDVWVCPTCGYAALKGEFPKIRSFQIRCV